MLNVGLRINWEKLELVPFQDTVHIDLRLMTNLEIVSVLSNRVEAIIQIVKITIRDNICSLAVHQDPGPVTEYIRREIGLYTSPHLDDFLAKDKEKFT